jgi:hypothetical protein
MLPVDQTGGRVTSGFVLRKQEEAARQQGSLFIRENSSNGGKAIGTFWSHTKF